MKTLSATFVLVLISLSAPAQWTTSGNSIYNTNSGNVGIGTSSPYLHSKLHAKSASSSPWTFLAESDANSRIIGMGHMGEYGVLAVSYLGNTAGYSPLQFWTENLPRMTIHTNGNIGMGTTLPSARLHITSAQHTYINLEKPNDATESGLVFTRAGGTTMFYFYSDDANNALKIQAAGLAGESDPLPRMQFPYANKNIYMAQSGGSVGIGTSTPDEKLTVKGRVHAEEVIIDLSVPGPDYVFEEDYQLPPLSSIEHYIKTNKHLPEVPSAKEMEQQGIKSGEMNMLLLKKVEELTLYIIELEKKMKKMEQAQQ